jgi:hypothetical protein
MNNINSIDFSDIIDSNSREQMINDNIQKAIEEIPESLTSVNMLYIPSIIKDKELKLFVDTGAQISVMPLEKAFELGIDNIIDYNYQGMVHGVGKQEIIGKIHYTEIQLNDFLLGCSFTILPDHEDIILGLDMLLAHGITIDLKKRCLILCNTEIPFCEKAD